MAEVKNKLITVETIKTVYDKLISLINGKSNNNHNHTNGQLYPTHIDLTPTNDAHGGYIDFHYNLSQDDYTTRIIESGAGQLFMLVGTQRYRILTEYKKPKGTYVGNGSATVRKIDISGEGEAILIKSADKFVIVTSAGAIGKVGSSSPQTLNTNECQFFGNQLNISTTNSLLNTNGETYSYEVL